MLLANAWRSSREQEWNRFAQEFACYYCRPLPERGLRFIRPNLQFSLEDHVPGIDSFVDDDGWSHPTLFPDSRAPNRRARAHGTLATGRDRR
jgi:hypothetical protein